MRVYNHKLKSIRLTNTDSSLIRGRKESEKLDKKKKRRPSDLNDFIKYNNCWIQRVDWNGRLNQ